MYIAKQLFRVLKKKILHELPDELNCTGGNTCLRAFEGPTMIDDFMSVVFSLKTLVPSPAIRSNYKGRLYPIFYDYNQVDLFRSTTGINKLFSVLASIPTNTHCPSTRCLWGDFRRSNINSLISTISPGPQLLGSSFFWMAENTVKNQLAAFLLTCRRFLLLFLNFFE